MEHLTVEDIINFLSIKALNKNTLKLAGRVNAHIQRCDKCLENLRAFELIQDEFTKIGTTVDTEVEPVEINREKDNKKDMEINL